MNSGPFTPAEVTITGWLLSALGIGCLVGNWHPAVGVVLCAAGLATTWRGTVGYDDLKWSEHDEISQRRAGRPVRDGEDEAVPLPMRRAAPRRGTADD